MPVNTSTDIVATLSTTDLSVYIFVTIAIASLLGLKWIGDFSNKCHEKATPYKTSKLSKITYAQGTIDYHCAIYDINHEMADIESGLLACYPCTVLTLIGAALGLAARAYWPDRIYDSIVIIVLGGFLFVKNIWPAWKHHHENWNVR